MFLSSPAAPTIQAAVVDQRQLWKSPSSAEAAGHALIVARGGRVNSFVLHMFFTKVAEEMVIVCLEDSFHYFSVHPTFFVTLFNCLHIILGKKFPDCCLHWLFPLFIVYSWSQKA